MPHKRSREKIIERRASQGAKRKANREEVLPVKRGDGTLDITPYVACLDIVTRGRYLSDGRGFIVTYPDEKKPSPQDGKGVPIIRVY